MGEIYIRESEIEKCKENGGQKEKGRIKYRKRG